jgi:hypothetical protein
MRRPWWIAVALAVVVVPSVAIAWRLMPAPPAGRSRPARLASASGTGTVPLMGALGLANKSGQAKGLLPPPGCAPDSATVVTCMAPAPGITGVVFSAYPSAAALYAAYVATVKSLNAGQFAQNYADCGPAVTAVAGEVGWNDQPRHPLSYTVALMAAGKVTDQQAGGRVFCAMTSGATEDIVWTRDDGNLLGWMAGTPRQAAWTWWAAVHDAIALPGSSRGPVAGSPAQAP